MNNLPFDVMNHINSFLPPKKEDLINEVYENNNYPSLEKLFQLLKKKKIDVSRKDVKDFLQNQIEQQLTTTQKLKKPQDI